MIDEVYSTPEEIMKAAKLAKWLIEEKGVTRKKAYIISQRKFHILNYDLVRKMYNKIKPKQEEMF